MQSALDGESGLHVAIIMDGNGRWATARGLPRLAGHRAGIDPIRAVVREAPSLGIATLTLFAFSSDNWRRPPSEVDALMRLLRRFLRSEAAQLSKNDVRLSLIGRRDRLPPGLAADIARAEATTASGETLQLRVAVDYSSRDAILAAAAACWDGTRPTRERLGRLLAGRADRAEAVDLMIRSGGERRLSDFLLWEAAYAELIFLDRLWPDFGTEDLRAAVEEFRRRDRRFGGLPTMASSAPGRKPVAA